MKQGNRAAFGKKRRVALLFISLTAVSALLLSARGASGTDSSEASDSSEFSDSSEASESSKPSENSEFSETSTSSSSETSVSSETSSSSDISESSNPSSSDFSEEERVDQRVEEILSSMSTEEKVAQMFLARYPDPDTAPAQVKEYQPGGYILFDKDFEGETADSVRAKIQACQDVSKIPMLMAVDEEGGTVNRVSAYLRDTPFDSPRHLYEQGGFSAVADDTEEKCQLLKSLSLNMNMAPVCDLSGDPEDFIYERAFSGTPGVCSHYVRQTVRQMNEAGIISVLKHFPGYGNNQDTHTGIAIDERSAETFYTQDFKPFQAGIEAGASCVLVSHNIVTCFDDQYPASLSPAIHQILREELGFDGVIITDDLAMGAIKDYTSGEDAAVLAVQAGNDLLCSTDFETQYQAVLQAVTDGTITEERLDESVRRILRLKLTMGLLKFS